MAQCVCHALSCCWRSAAASHRSPMRARSSPAAPCLGRSPPTPSARPSLAQHRWRLPARPHTDIQPPHPRSVPRQQADGQQSSEASLRRIPRVPGWRRDTCTRTEPLVGDKGSVKPYHACIRECTTLTGVPVHHRLYPKSTEHNFQARDHPSITWRGHHATRSDRPGTRATKHYIHSTRRPCY